MIPPGNRRLPAGFSPRQEAGFSLLEIIIGFVVLSVVTVGLTSFSGVQRKALTRSGDRSEAAQAVITELEKLKAPLADTIRFKYRQTQLKTNGPITTTRTSVGKRISYSIRIVQSQVVGTNHLIRFSGRATWGGRDTVSLGVLVARP